MIGFTPEWGCPIDPSTAKFAECTSLQDASKKCREYIERNELGGGNWIGGAVFFCKDGSVEFVQVARVSYNGRIWDMSGKEICSVQAEPSTVGEFA
jgi:hypothetical protein